MLLLSEREYQDLIDYKPNIFENCFNGNFLNALFILNVILNEKSIHFNKWSAQFNTEIPGLEVAILGTRMGISFLY